MTAPYSHFIGDPDSLGDQRVPRGFQPRPWHKSGPYRLIFKRIFDIILVLSAAPVVLPMVMFLAFLIWRRGGKPFYSQPRIGRNGYVFRMWKLRTMQVDADEFIATYLANNPAAREEWDRTQKLRNDPRISEFGRFLRRSSLDELPQLWNVLRGDMSLVGPRPMMVHQRQLYPGKGYYDLRPGLTGYWQVTERNQSSFARRAEWDDKYEAELSLCSDAKVMLRTVRVVIDGTGC